ncbi:MAG: MoxR family ATPase [Clostridia bacterium]|nr:MoxR family ATPase [Clostridia bacterium]
MWNYGFREAASLRTELEAVRRELEKVIAGKSDVIGKVLTAVIADGHILLDDVPGVGKTSLAVALGKALDLCCRRIQFTPDVLPSDIVGFSLYDKDSGTFLYRPGVVSGANLLLGDEINRTSSKTQSALLEAMEEKQVTVDGNTYPMEKPFLVIATQNRVGMAGTQALPYAQMDRFMVCLTVGYPDHDAQMDMLRARQSGDPLENVQTVMSRETLLAMQRDARRVTVKDAIVDYITRLCVASRAHPMLDVGVSPRGTLHVQRMSQARAYAEGRDYVTGADVQAVFRDVCAHRVVLSRKARAEGIDPAQALDALLRDTANPDRGEKA